MIAKMFCPNCEKMRDCERIGIDSAEKFEDDKRMYLSVAYRCHRCGHEFNAAVHDVIDSFEGEQGRLR